jgi:hypothetical protein
VVRGEPLNAAPPKKLLGGAPDGVEGLLLCVAVGIA